MEVPGLRNAVTCSLRLSLPIPSWPREIEVQSSELWTRGVRRESRGRNAAGGPTGPSVPARL